MTARVHVVTPMFNAERTIGETVASVRAQSAGSWRLTVVDDGSTDGSARAARAAAGGDPRVEVVGRRNGGLSAARNTGIDRAAGEAFTVFLDADDWLASDGLERQLAAAETGGAEVVSGAVELRDGAGRRIGVREGSATSIGAAELFDLAPLLVHGQMIRTGLLCSCRFDESVGLVEDYEFYFRLVRSGCAWRTHAGVVGGYRVGGASMSRDHGAMLRATREVLSRASAALPAGEASSAELRERAARSAVRASVIYATRAAVAAAWAGDPEWAGRGLGLLDVGRGEVEAWSAASAALDAAALALAIDPLGSRRDRFEGIARAWWSVLEEGGWAEGPGFAERAAGLLDGLGRSASSTAGALLDRAAARAQEAGGTVRLVGLGKNGSLLAREAGSRGWRVLARDDRLDADPGLVERVRAAAGGTTIDSEPMDAPLDPPAPTIVTPAAGDGLAVRMERLARAGGEENGSGGGGGILRWSEAFSGDAAGSRAGRVAGAGSGGR